MRTAWKSDIGKIRNKNEDSILADEERGIFILADGMGGHRGGEEASDLAVRTAHDFLKERVRMTTHDNMLRLLAEALAAAHSAVYRKGREVPELAEMGTTLEMAVLKEDKLYFCHVGDSRIYFFHDGELRQMTMDDNLAALLVQREQVPKDQVPPNLRLMLTQAVGVSQELLPELRTIQLYPGDIVLICSDGLSEMVEDREIEEILKSSGRDLSSAVDLLIDEANTGGGVDNISVLLIEQERSMQSPPSFS